MSTQHLKLCNTQWQSMRHGAHPRSADAARSLEFTPQSRGRHSEHGQHDRHLVFEKSTRGHMRSAIAFDSPTFTSATLEHPPSVTRFRMQACTREKISSTVH